MRRWVDGCGGVPGARQEKGEKGGKGGGEPAEPRRRSGDGGEGRGCLERAEVVPCCTCLPPRKCKKGNGREPPAAMPVTRFPQQNPAAFLAGRLASRQQPWQPTPAAGRHAATVATVAVVLCVLAHSQALTHQHTLPPNPLVHRPMLWLPTPWPAWPSAALCTTSAGDTTRWGMLCFGMLCHLLRCP